MTTFSSNPQIISADQFDMTASLAHMGLNENGAVIMAYAGSGQWKDGGKIVRGNECHGSSLPQFWVDDWDPNPLYTDELAYCQNNYWNAVNPWFVIYPKDDNTCTNAAVQWRGAEVYYLSVADGLWHRVSSQATRVLRSVEYYTASTFVGSGVTADQIFVPGGGNIPGFCPAISAARGAPSSTTTDYRAMHTSLLDYDVIDGSDVAGFFATCEVRVQPVDGVAFNATPKILMQLGMDLEPTSTDTVGTGYLVGASYKVSVSNSRFNLIPTDGSWRRLYCSTYLHADTIPPSVAAYANVAADFTGNPITRQY